MSDTPSASTGNGDTQLQMAWYCLRTQTKHEHIAAANLLQMVEGTRVFNPRLRLRKATRRGVVWFNEPLFPCYLFVRFDLATMLDKVMYTPGVKMVVQFGDRTPSIPENVIEQLRQDFDENGVHVVGDDLAQGDEVTIARGPFQGLQAVVLRILPAPQRVQVLLNILGQTTPVEVHRDLLIREGKNLAPKAPETLRSKET